MANIERFLDRQKEVQEENEKRLQEVFDEFLGELRSSQDFVSIWEHSFNTDQTRQLERLLRSFLETESAFAQTVEELERVWGPILNLSFFDGPIYLPAMMNILERRKKELEHW